MYRCYSAPANYRVVHLVIFSIPCDENTEDEISQIKDMMNDSENSIMETKLKIRELKRRELALKKIVEA